MEWKEETGVGAAIPASNHVVKGIWALKDFTSLRYIILWDTL